MLINAAASWLGSSSPHDGAEQLLAFLLAHRLGAVQFLKNRLHRRVPYITSPAPRPGLLKQARAVVVRIDSGWNWKPHAATVVAHRHHHLAETGVDGKIGRDIAADQRVVARHRQRVGHAGEHACAIVNDCRGFAVQDLARLADLAAVGFDDRLVTETDADDRQPAAQALQQFRHAARFGRRTGAGDSISTGWVMCSRRSMITSAAIWLR